MDFHLKVQDNRFFYICVLYTFKKNLIIQKSRQNNKTMLVKYVVQQSKSTALFKNSRNTLFCWEKIRKNDLNNQIYFHALSSHKGLQSKFKAQTWHFLCDTQYCIHLPNLLDIYSFRHAPK
jgi:hypothetical protein